MTLGKIGARDMMYRWRNPYVTDGLVAMWDGEWNAGGGVHDPDATVWKDLVGVVDMPNCVFGENYSLPTVSTSRTSNVFSISSDFTLHGSLVTANSIWSNWTMLGIGDTSVAGIQKGICLVGLGGTNFGTVQYRKSYSGTVLNSVSTGMSVGNAYTYDLVFVLNTLTYKVFVNGTQVGDTQINSDDWVLSDSNVGIGMQFSNANNMGDYKRHNILFYSRALTSAEISANYAIDKRRFNLP